MDAAQFVTTLRARVDWLNAKVTNATNAWNEYQRACDSYTRQHGPRPWTARESWVQRLTTWADFGGVRASDNWTTQVDRPYGVRFTDVFGDMRDATRAYQRIVQEQGNTVVLSPVQIVDVGNLRSRGDQLARNAQTLSSQWANSYAGAWDTKVTTDSDRFLRSVAALTPFSRYQAAVPDLTTALTQPGGGSATGVEPQQQQQQQVLPPWVAPVVGGILVVGVGYALWRYSKTH